MSENTTQQNEQSVIPAETGNSGPSVEFFAIGIAINLVLLIAFFVWAFRQGKKRNRPED